MKLLDLAGSRDSVLGETSGERINTSINKKKRSDAGLPPQREAKLIDTDGTVRRHSINVYRNGRPQKKVSVKLFSSKKEAEFKEYVYTGKEGVYILYQEV